jgi:hypothetical protein
MTVQPHQKWVRNNTFLLGIYIYTQTHTHTHTHIYIYIYIHICVCVSVYKALHMHMLKEWHMHWLKEWNTAVIIRLRFFTCIISFVCQHDHKIWKGRALKCLYETIRFRRMVSKARLQNRTGWATFFFFLSFFFVFFLPILLEEN